MSKLLTLTSYAKFELNSWTNCEITIKLPITDIFGCLDTAKVRMTSYLNNGYDIINCFAKFLKLLPHSIIIPSFMSVGSQMPELDGGGGEAFLPPYKMGSQNTPYKSGLTFLGGQSP